MMKLTLNKQHLNHKSGEPIEVTEEQAHYFKMMGMVKDHGQFVDKGAPIKKKGK